MKLRMVGSLNVVPPFLLNILIVGIFYCRLNRIGFEYEKQITGTLCVTGCCCIDDYRKYRFVIAITYTIHNFELSGKTDVESIGSGSSYT
jgi:hypothetical protein